MRILLFLTALAGPVQAEVVLAARTLRPQTIVTESDIVIGTGHVPGALDDPAQVIGKETRVAIYAGRHLRPGDVGPPAVIARNQIVQLEFHRGHLSILVEGRSLTRAGVGDRVRVMNLASRSTVSGVVQADGSIAVK